MKLVEHNLGEYRKYSLETEDADLNPSSVAHLPWTWTKTSLRLFLYLLLGIRPTSKGLKVEPTRVNECENVLLSGKPYRNKEHHY